MEENGNRMLYCADRLKALRGRKEELEDALKACNAEIDAAEEALAEIMAQSDTPSFRHAGNMFVLTSRVRASAARGHKDELFDALRSEGYGEMITETVNANTLSSFVKEQMEENGDRVPGWLDGLVNVFTQTAINVRKA